MVGSDFSFTMNVKENDKPKSSESSKSSKKSKTINTLIQQSQSEEQPEANQIVEEEIAVEKYQSSRAPFNDNDTSPNWIEIKVEDTKETKEMRSTNQNIENEEIKERGGIGKKEYVFFADDFYICHQSIQLQFENIKDDSILLQMFICGKDLL